MRTTDGAWITGFFGHLADSDILQLELLGIFHGLEEAWKRGYRIVECRSDYLHAISLVEGILLAVMHMRRLFGILETSWPVRGECP